MQSNLVRTILDTRPTSASTEHETLLALADGATVAWARLALRAQLDDDTLSDAVEALLARRAIAIIRSPRPAAVSLRITDAGRRELASRVLEWSSLDGLARGIERLAEQRRDGTNGGVGKPARVTGESAPAPGAARAGGT